MLERHPVPEEREKFHTEQPNTMPLQSPHPAATGVGKVSFIKKRTKQEPPSRERVQTSEIHLEPPVENKQRTLHREVATSL